MEPLKYGCDKPTAFLDVGLNRRKLASINKHLISSLKRAGRVLVLALMAIGIFTMPSIAADTPPMMATPGKMNVSSTGAFTYTIPIIVPPGTNNVVPALSLDYSSQYGDGTAGMGWALTGLPTVTRCPQTLAQDSVHGGVNYNSDDRACMNGQRLILVGTGNYWDDGTQYRTEVDTFSEIILHLTTGAHPYRWFEVHSKNGQILQFGNSPDSRLYAVGTNTTRTWAVNQISDTKGNYLSVTYVDDATDGAAYPLEIDYTAHDSPLLVPNNAVKFVYTPLCSVDPVNCRQDIIPAYQAGSLMQTPVLLREIDTYTNETTPTPTLVSSYKLSYQNAGTTVGGHNAAHDELISVQQCPATGSCFTATEFDWQGSGNTPSVDSSNIMTIGQWAETYILPSIAPGDFDGDGITDVVVINPYEPTTPFPCPPASGYTFYIGTGTGTPTSYHGTNSYNYCPLKGPSFTFPYYSKGMATGDFNGDGITDLVDENQFAVANWTALINSGSAFTPGPLNTMPTNYGLPLAFADFNGDGLTDALSEPTYSTYPAGPVTFYNSNTIGDGSFTTAAGPANAGTYVNSADFDGDGCADIIGETGTNQVTIFYSCNPAVSSSPAITVSSLSVPAIQITGDFNGDGKADFIDTAGHLYLSTGTSLIATDFVAPAGWAIDNAVAGDFNGDGKQDIVVQDLSHNDVEIWLSTGQTGCLSGCSSSGTPAFTRLSLLPISPSADPVFVVADWNNDGAQDVWIQSATSVQPELLFGYVPELVTKVTDGLGAYVSAQYKPLSAKSTFYTGGSAAYPIQTMGGGHYFVSQTSTSNGIGTGTYDTTYSYEGAQTDLKGRGFLGFAKITATDQETHLFTTTTYSTTFPTVGMIEYQVRTCPSSVCSTGPLELQNVSNCVTPPVCFDVVNEGGAPGSGSAYYFVGIQQTVAASKDLDNSALPTVTTSYQYDCDSPGTCYGNATQVLVCVPDSSGGTTACGASTDAKTTTNSYTNYVATVSGANYWLIGRLTKSKVRSQVGSSDITRVTTFCYDLPSITGCTGTTGIPSGLLIQQIVEPAASDATLTLETDYQLDDYGNRHVTTQSGCVWIPSTSCSNTDSTASRATRVTYATGGEYNAEFPTTIKDALLNSETLTYNFDYGTTASSKDINGLTTLWSYDGFGRETSEIRSDGNKTKISYTYCTGLPSNESCPTHAAFDVIATPQNSSNAQNGPISITYYDHLARIIAKDIEGFDIGTGSCAVGLPCWIRVETDYDERGNVGAASRPYFIDSVTPQCGPTSGTPPCTTYTYDALERVVEADLPNGSETKYGFMGLTTTVAHDAAGLDQVTTTKKNPQGLVKSVQDANLKTATYVYDAFGNLTNVTDSLGHSTVNTYDDLGRKLSSTSGDTGLWSYLYDGFGELAWQTDGSGNKINLQYDAMRHTVYRTETGPNTTWTYGPSAVPCGVEKLTNAYLSSSTYNRAITYDATIAGACQPSTITFTPGSGPPVSYTITYNSDGRVATVVYPSGFTAKYVYTTLGYLSQIVNNANGNILIKINLRNAEMQWTSLTNQGSITTTRTFNTNTGLLNESDTPVSGPNIDLSFGYDKIGNLVSRGDSSEPYVERFCYDPLNRVTSYALTSSTSCPLTGSSATTVAYDEIGNITSKSDVASGGTYSYGAGGAGAHAVTQISGTVWPGVNTPQFDYGAKGNLNCIYTGTSCSGGIPFRQYAYTSYGMVSSLTQTSSTLGNVSLTYSYDDQRARFQQVQHAGSDTRTTLYFNFGGLTSEQVTDGSTVTTNDYIQVDGEIVAEHTIAGGSGTNYFFVNDNLGSVTAVLNSSGTVTERDSYDAWGLRRNEKGTPNPTQCLPPMPSLTTRGYTNQEMVDAACLVNLNARFYDPLIARMPQPDSTIPDSYNMQSLNRYSYVNNGPLSATDPTGNFPINSPGFNSNWNFTIFLNPRSQVEYDNMVYGIGANQPAAAMGADTSSGSDVTINGSSAVSGASTSGPNAVSGIPPGPSEQTSPTIASVNSQIAQKITDGTATAPFPASDPVSSGTNGRMQVADAEPDVDVEPPEPEVNGQTVEESQAASEMDNAAGEAVAKEQAAEGSGQDTAASEARSEEQYRSQINRAEAAKVRAQWWQSEAEKNPFAYSSADLARMQQGKAPIGDDGYPMELHHVGGMPASPLEPMTRTEHRLGPNYLINHPWLGDDQ